MVRDFLKKYSKILVGSVICLAIVFSVTLAFLFFYNRSNIIKTNDAQLKSLSDNVDIYEQFFSGYLNALYDEEKALISTVDSIVDLEGAQDDSDIIVSYLESLDFGAGCLVDKSRQVLFDGMGALKGVDLSHTEYDPLFSDNPSEDGDFASLQQGDFTWVSYPLGSFLYILQQANTGVTDYNSSYTWDSILKNSWVGDESDLAVVSREDGSIVYCKDESLEGINVDVSGINDSFTGVIGGKRYIARTMPCDERNVDFLALTPINRVISSCISGVRMEMLLFFILLILLICFVVFLRADELDASQEFTLFGKYFLRTQVRRFLALSVVCGVSLFFVSHFLTGLNNISETSDYLREQAKENIPSIVVSQEVNNDIDEKNDRIFFKQGRALNVFLNTYGGELTKDVLNKISGIFGVKGVSVFDLSGDTILSSTSLDHVSLLGDKESSLYELRYVLMGKESMRVKGDPNLMDITDVIFAVPMKDAEDITNGLIAVITLNGQSESLLYDGDTNDRSQSSFINLKRSEDGSLLFAVDFEGNITVHLDGDMIGKPVTQYDISMEDLGEGLSGLITINGEKFLASSVEYENGYVILTSAFKWVTLSTLLRAAISLILFVLISLWILYDGLGSKYHFEDRKARVIDADDRRAKITWKDFDTKKKFAFVIRGAVYVFSLYLIWLYFMGRNFRTADMGFYYIVSGEWSKSLNTFSILGNLCLICIIFSIVGWIGAVLKFVPRVMGASGVTFCRLLSSIVKYVGAAVAFYYCAINFGIDAQAAWTSLGLAGVGLSFGAQDLIKDVIAGIFILFEGNFKVGDMLLINGEWFWVRAIGVRTTRVEAWGTVKLINNSQMTSGVANIQNATAAVNCDVYVGREYDIRDIEEILRKDLPRLKEDFPPEVATPVYKGVQHITAQGVQIRIRTYCPPLYQGWVGRSLKREVAIILSNHNIRVSADAYDIRSYAVSKEEIIGDMEESVKRIHESAEQIRQENEAEAEVEE